MKTSIKSLGLLFGLILAAAAWAQDEAEETAQQGGGEVAEEAADSAASTESTEQAATEEAPETEAGESTQADESTATEENGDTAPAEDTSPAAAEAESADEPGAQDASGAETFVFQPHPIFTPATAELVYRPLVNYLNDSLPYRFDLEIVPDYHRYWLSIRRGENPHLVLEEPHLTAYRIERYNFTPLVRAAEPRTYSMLTSMDNAEASVRDFIGRPVSTMPAPSLGYLILADWYDNPMQQPIIQSNASSWLDAVEIVFSMEADAAIVPNNLVSRYVNMANILTSQEFPGVTISASPAVPVAIQEEIRDALLALHEDEEHFAALNELDISQFVEARPAQYEGLDEWLELVYSTL
ncbi:MAG: PhnD/SsuA/transferrin family substrate-binding protein [Gammaproteobacteria bacterium]|jgi:hypothetical protein|nr:PhnD/SsuA/transferrin family substrate-binding protein [Gammaproteobacteria bacterium]